MSNFPALVTINELSLSEEEQKRIVRLYMEKSITYLSPDKEFGFFALYSVGDDLETIALKTGISKDVILVTAIHYRWHEKIKYLKKDTKEIASIQKDLANTLLIATYKSVLRDLGDVITGKKTAKEVQMIPKNIGSLSQLMDMVKDLNNLVEAIQPPQTTVVHAENVQINHQVSTPINDSREAEVIDPKRLEMLKAIDT